MTSNCRNTQPIHSAAYKYHRGEPIDPPNLHGDDVHFISGPTVRMACPEGHQEQVQVVLSDSYRPDRVDWLWIEHGQQHDPVNSFFLGGEPRWSRDKRPIFLAADGEICDAAVRRMLDRTHTSPTSFPYPLGV